MTAVAVSILVGCVGPAPASASGQFNGTFSFDEQELWVRGTAGGEFLVGMAFAPDGSIWVANDQTAQLKRYGTLYKDNHGGAVLNGSKWLHEVDVVGPDYTSTDVKITNLVNDPKGTPNMYGLGPNGIYRYSTFTGAKNLGPYCPAGTTGRLGLAAAPNGDIYFAVDRAAPYVSEIWRVSNTLTDPTPICTVSRSDDMDAIVLDPTGQYLFLALDGVSKIRVLTASGVFQRDINTAQPNPDGLCFHDCDEPYLVSNNNNGTINRFDFPNGYASGTVNQTVMASGGFRGDFVAVHGGYMYATQWPGNGFSNGTRYDNGAEDSRKSIVRVGRCFFSFDSTCTRTPSGMTDWWPLDETVPGHTTTADVIGKYPGAIKGTVASIAGYSGLGFHFPGTAPSGYVDCGPMCGNFGLGGSSQTQPTGAFSIDAWVKLDQPHNSCSVVVDKHLGTTSYVGYQLQVNSSGFPQFVMGVGGPPVAATSSKAITNTDWHHLAVIVSPSSWINGSSPVSVKYSCGLYLDGTSVGGAVTPYFSPLSMSSTANFYIGGNNTTCAFGGGVDEVELFDRMLTNREIAALSMDPKCRCHVETCKLQEVAASDNLRETKFKICNDGGEPQAVNWSITKVPASTNPACTNGNAIVSFSPSSGSVFLQPHECVTVAVQATLLPYSLLTTADVACYQVTTDACGPNGVALGSFVGPLQQFCVVNADTCFQLHRGWGNIPVNWTVQNTGPTGLDLNWFVKERGAEGDTAYSVISLNGLPPGDATASSVLHLEPYSSANVSVTAWMFGSQAQHPSHLQLFASVVGDTIPDQPVADLSVFSDETSGSRYAGWAIAASQQTQNRYDGTMIFDRAHSRMVLLGGIVGCCFGGDPSLATGIDVYRTDIDSISSPGTSGSGPYQILGHSAIYDPIRQRMLLFGGKLSYNGSPNDQDVYALTLTGGSLESWSTLVTSGTKPPARYAHTAIYDPVGDRMIVTGGLTSPSDSLADTWALSLGGGTPTWTQLPSNPYSKLVRHAAVYDRATQRMITFGGAGDESNQLFALSLSGSPAWTALQPPGSGPISLARCVAYVDSATHSLTIMGGSHYNPSLNETTYNPEIWTLPLGAGGSWSTSTPYGGSALTTAAGALSPGISVGGFDYVFGGERNGSSPAGGWPSLYAIPSDRGVASAAGPVSVGPPTTKARLALRIGPNPFRASTSFGITLSERARVKLSVYDIAGRQVLNVDAGMHGPGEFRLPWDGRDGAGQSLRPGVYLVRVRAGNMTEDGRVIRIN